jgi:hypothetical protein
VQAACGAAARNGMSSAGAEVTATDSEASASSISTSITTTTTDAVIVSAVCGGANGNATPASGQVEFFDSPDPATPTPLMFGAGSTKASTGAAGSKTFGWTVSSSMPLTAVGAAFAVVTAQQGTLVTSYGCNCNGTFDNTSCLNAAWADRANWVNNTLIFPVGGVCRFNSKFSWSNHSNFTILGNGAVLKTGDGMSGSGSASKTLSTVDNFVIDNLDADDNRATRTCALGSQGGGSSNWQITRATNGTFRNVDWHNGCYDGARIAGSNKLDTNTFPKNLTFLDSKFNNNFRNGVSVIQGWNIRFLGTCTPGTGGNWFQGTCTCQFTNSNGGSPQAGFDWEPNQGDASPANQDGLIDGCLFAGNLGSAYSDHKIAGSKNMTLRSSIIRDGGINVQADGGLVENNYLRFNVINDVRFAWVYQVGSSSTASPLNPGRAPYVGDNFFDGSIPVSTENGSTRLNHYGNFGNGTAQFKNNEITNSGMSPGGDWCQAGPTGGVSTTSGNTLQGTLQSPNPGCP